MNQRLRTVARRAWRLLREHVGLLAVLGIALAFRLAYLRWFKVFPPGDVFNFISIARGLPSLDYPPGEKRLPFFPLLLLATHAVLDWEPAGLVVAVGASLAALVLLYALGRTLRFSKTSLAVVLLVFQAQPQFLIASTRGYADTTLIALVLGSLLALVRTRTWRGGILTGMLLGGAALTRYEGGAVAALLLPLWILLPRRLPRRVPLVALAAFAMTILPYAVLALANERPVVGAGYFAEAKTEGRYGTSSLRTAVNNGLEMWRRVGLWGVWNLPVGIAREIIGDPLGTPRILTNRLTEPGHGMALFAVIGVIFLLARHRAAFLWVAVTYFAATLPPAWYHPFPRYDIFLMPATTLFAAAGFTSLQRRVERGTAAGRPGVVVRTLLGLMLMIVVSGLWLPNLAERTRDSQQKHNGRDYAHYQAIHAARTLQGRIAFDTNADIVRIYFRDRAFFLPSELADRRDAAGAIAQLRAAGVSTLVIAGGRASKYPFLDDARLERVADFTWPQGNHDTSRAAIYRIRE